MIEKDETRLLTTTAGDREREAKSRRFNALEGLGIITIILVVLWPVCGLFGIVGGNETVQRLSPIPLFVLAVYMLFISPFIHRDELSSWGLGSPRGLFKHCQGQVAAGRILVFAVVSGLFVGLTYAHFASWDRVVHFLGFDETALATLKESMAGAAAVLLWGALLTAVLLTCILRYDNFVPAFITALKIVVPFWCFVCLAALAHRGPGAFKGFDASEYVRDMFGYLFWGIIQQLVFASYFGIRLRKGFGPSDTAPARLAGGRMFRMIILFGGGIAVTAGLGLYIGLRSLYGPERVMLNLMWGAMLFAFPLGAVYGFFFTRDSRRLMVATLIASCFALVHIDSYGLVIATCLMGIPLAYVFMEDRNRNLVALGVVHGILGSTLDMLFARSEAGILKIGYRVGPWSLHAPSPWVLVFPMICIAGYVVLMAWCFGREEMWTDTD